MAYVPECPQLTLYVYNTTDCSGEPMNMSSSSSSSSNSSSSNSSSSSSSSSGSDLVLHECVESEIYYVPAECDSSVYEATTWSLAVTISFSAITIDEWDEDTETLFLDGLAASLNVDASRITILSVSAGSVVVETQVSGFTSVDDAAATEETANTADAVVFDDALGAVEVSAAAPAATDPEEVVEPYDLDDLVVEDPEEEPVEFDAAWTVPLASMTVVIAAIAHMM